MKNHRVLSVSVSICLSAALLGAALLLFPHRKAHADPLGVQQFFTVQTSNNIAQTLMPSPTGGVKIYSVSGFCGDSVGTNTELKIYSQNSLGTVDIAELWASGPDGSQSVSNSLASFYFVTPFQGASGTPLQVALVGCDAAATNGLFIQFSAN